MFNIKLICFISLFIVTGVYKDCNTSKEKQETQIMLCIYTYTQFWNNACLCVSKDLVRDQVRTAAVSRGIRTLNHFQ